MIMRVFAVALMAVVGAVLIVACQPADTTAPTVRIVGPAGDSVKVATAATIKVYAKDDVDNNIAKIRFYVGSILKDSATTAEIVADTATFTWTPALTDIPAVTLKVNADDKSSNKSADDTLRVQVKP